MCLQNIIVVLGPEQRFENTVWILWRRWLLQTHQTHIGPTLHVGPVYGHHIGETSVFFRKQQYLIFHDHELYECVPPLLC